MLHAQLNPIAYEKERKITDEELAPVNLTPARFHGEWNYVIRPNQ
jgi:hypothetical protein